MSCPTFSNLKTLALGESCISTGADLETLASLFSFFSIRLIRRSFFFTLKWYAHVHSESKFLNTYASLLDWKYYCGWLINWFLFDPSKRTLTFRRHWEEVWNRKEDLLLAITLKWWRSDAPRMIQKSICWHSCLGVMDYHLRRVLCVGVGISVSRFCQSLVLAHYY